MVGNISSLTDHVVDDSVSVNTDTVGTAGLDHAAELSTGTHTGSEAVRDWLVARVVCQ